MSKIKVLDQGTINQIAAGEVIDRPSSIVKELMENSIDAGADKISVEIKDGGISLIRITDNGMGIDKEDIPVAFKRHATSKIKSALDLLTVSSLGFRGEALSSIAAVCQVELLTKTKDSLMGVRYKIEGGREILFEDIGTANGTTFIVRNLFFNTPARRKFLKSAQTETGYISDIIEKIALSHPEISINFINNGKTKIHTPGNGKLLDTIYAIYGLEITKNILPIEIENEYLKVRGFIGKNIIARGNRNNEIYFINNRFIKNNILNKAIEEGYKNILMQHKYPFTVINFEIDPSFIDVNVHPSKMELRFRKSENIYPFISENVRNILVNSVNIIDADNNNEDKRDFSKKPEPFENNRELSKNTEEIKDNTELDKKPQALEDNTELLKKSELAQNNRIIENNIGLSPIKPTEEIKSIEKIKEVEANKSLTTDNKYIQREIDAQFDEFITEYAKPKHKLIGQVFETYWIIEYENKLYIIDQHAAHEKVNFEKLMKKVRENKASTQMINPPLVLNLTVSETILVNKYLENFRNIGYDIESFGENEFVVRGVPADLLSLNSTDVLMEIIDNLTLESGKMMPDMVNDKIASMSCKAAVKGNNYLSAAEMDELVGELLKCENPYNCPHGRPTIISMSKYELDKKFKRII